MNTAGHAMVCINHPCGGDDMSSHAAATTCMIQQMLRNLCD
jgi:hypothetical protein